MNWYNSKPNTAPAYQPLKSQGLMSAPNGQQTLATTNLGGNMGGGRTYVPNRFQNPMPQGSVPGLTAPMGGKSSALPAGPMKGPNMGFGSPVPGNQFMGTGMSNMGSNLMGQAIQGAGGQTTPANTRLQNQMLQAGILRSGGGRIM